MARKYAYGEETDGRVTEMWTIRSTPAAAAARKRRADAAMAHSNVDRPRGNLIQNVLWSTSIPASALTSAASSSSASGATSTLPASGWPGGGGERTSVRTWRSRARSSRAIAEPVYENAPVTASTGRG